MEQASEIGEKTKIEEERVQFADLVAQALVHLVGGDEDDTRWHEELRYLADDTTTAHLSHSLDDRPWNLQSRAATALYHRHRDPQGALVLRSSLGLERRWMTPQELGHLLVRELEELFRENGLVMDVRCNEQNGFVLAVDQRRIDALRQAGRWACPYCVRWCKGEKGLWWHCQQLHGVDYSSALADAAAQRSVLAIVEYGSQLGKVATINYDASHHDGSKNPFDDVRAGNILSVQNAVASGWDPTTAQDEKGASPLLWAAGSGHLDMVRYLIGTGCDPTFRQKARRAFEGRTALHWAARNGHTLVVEYLAEECRVDIDAKTADGTTAFCWAAWQGHEAVLRLLQSRKCDCTAMNRFGCNAVLWAAQGGGTEALLEWLECVGRCNVFLVNSNGHGVLHKAAQRGHMGICRWFLRRLLELSDQSLSFDLIGPDSDGCTPSDLAGMEQHDDLAHFLAKKEKDIIQALVVERNWAAPAWFGKAPVSHDSLVWESWAGVGRMRAATHRIVSGVAN